MKIGPSSCPCAAARPGRRWTACAATGSFTSSTRSAAAPPAWVADHLPALQAADPAVPEGLDDRQADNWRPLLAIADEAGGAWPGLARTIARALSGAVVEADLAAPVRLLADLRDLFATVTALEDRPWADDAQGHPLTPRHLAQLLAGFGIKGKQIRQGRHTCKGYLRADFTDAFRRYLPPDPKHAKHRPGPAAFAIQGERRGSGSCFGARIAPNSRAHWQRFGCFGCARRGSSRN